MSHLPLYLWKEWRDQRAALLGLAIALPALVAVGALAAPGFLDVSAGAGMLTAVLVVGADLIPGELRRSKLRFLERMPAGLGTAFAAKLAMFVACVLGAAVFGGALARLALLVLGERSLPFDAHAARLLLPALGCALWTFAVSAWVPRSALAFPTAVVAIAALCWPGWLFYQEHSWFEPYEWEPKAFFAVCALGACVAAWVSFVFGYMAGGSPGRAARRGLAVSVLLLSPAWTWAGVRLHRTTTIDPGAADFWITSCMLGEEARWAFVNAKRARNVRQRGPQHALVVDLHSGEWRSVGKRGDSFRADWREGGSIHPPTWRRVVLEAVSQIAFDGRTGAVAADQRWQPEGLQLPTAAELGLDDERVVMGYAGLGYLTMERGRFRSAGWYDPFRQRHFCSNDLAPAGEDSRWSRALVRSGPWIVHEARAGVRLFEPETREEHDVPGLSPAAYLGPVLADGRALVLDGGRVFLLAGHGTEVEEVALGHGQGEVTAAWAYGGYGSKSLLRDDARVLEVDVRGWGRGPARLELEALRLELALGKRSRRDTQLLACPDEDHAIVLENDRRIVRLRFGSDEREVLFPR